MTRGVIYQDDFEEHLLIDLHELLIPLLNISSFLARIGVIVSGRGWVGSVVCAPLDDLLENSLVDLMYT